jgi:hypothetical protein
MEQNVIDLWANYAFDKMRKEKTIMPKVINSILESPDFKTSGVSEEELKIAIKKRLENERQIILNKIKYKLKDID